MSKKFAVNIEKLPSGSYRIRKTYKGESYKITVAYEPTELEAAELIMNEINRCNIEDGKGLTFYKAANEYINDKSNVLSPSSIREYDRKNNYLKSNYPKFSGKLAKRINQKDVQNLINNYAANIDPKTVRDMHGFISAVLKYSAPGLILNTTLPQPKKKKVYIPADEDVKKLAEHIKGSRYELAVMLASCGLRRSEICALSLDDIEGNKIYIHNTKLQNKAKEWVIRDNTKSPAGTREVEVPEIIIETIKKQGYIYRGHPKCITDYIKRTLDKLGLPRFTLHKLRHYYASAAHSMNIPNAYIMEQGGWKTESVLNQVYRHAMEDKKNEMSKKTISHLNDIFR